MKRETKLGLVVSGSFLCLFGALMGRKLLLPDNSASPDANTASVAQAPANPPAKNGNGDRLVEPGKLPLKTASMQEIKPVSGAAPVSGAGAPTGALPLLPGHPQSGTGHVTPSSSGLPQVPDAGNMGDDLEELRKQAEKAKFGMYAPNKKPALPPAAIPDPPGTPLIVAKGQPGAALPAGPPLPPPTFPSGPSEPALTPPAPEPIGGVKPALPDKVPGTVAPVSPTPTKPAATLPGSPPALPPAAPPEPVKVQPLPVAPTPPAPPGFPEPVAPVKTQEPIGLGKPGGGIDIQTPTKVPAPPVIPGKIPDSPPLPVPVSVDPGEPQNKFGGANPGLPPSPPAPIAPPVGAQPPGKVEPINVKTIPVVDAPDLVKPKPVATKGTLVETFICDADTLTFAAISKRMYKSENYADALLLFNRQNPHPNAPTSIYQNPPVLKVGSAILIPKTVDLEATYPTAIKHLTPSTSASPPAVKPPVVAATPGIGTIPPSSPGVPVKVSDGVGKGWPEPAAVGATYQVKADAMIFQIAHDTLGDGKRWSEIYRLNPNIDTRYPIRAGTMLKLPAGARPVQ